MAAALEALDANTGWHNRCLEEQHEGCQPSTGRKLRLAVCSVIVRDLSPNRMLSEDSRRQVPHMHLEKSWETLTLPSDTAAYVPIRLQGCHPSLLDVALLPILFGAAAPSPLCAHVPLPYSHRPRAKDSRLLALRLLLPVIMPESSVCCSPRPAFAFHEPICMTAQLVLGIWYEAAASALMAWISLSLRCPRLSGWRVECRSSVDVRSRPS